jgi:hypothetical protein
MTISAIWSRWRGDCSSPWTVGVSCGSRGWFGLAVAFDGGALAMGGERVLFAPAPSLCLAGRTGAEYCLAPKDKSDVLQSAFDLRESTYRWFLRSNSSLIWWSSFIAIYGSCTGRLAFLAGFSKRQTHLKLGVNVSFSCRWSSVWHFSTRLLARSH